MKTAEELKIVNYLCACGFVASTYLQLLNHISDNPVKDKAHYHYYSLHPNPGVTEAKRDSVNYRYDALDPQFLKFMAMIGGVAANKYGDPLNYLSTIKSQDCQGTKVLSII
jgi:hypothetical protein